MGTEELFTRYAAELDDELQAVMPGEPPGLAGMVRYHMGWVDEQLRPARAKAGKQLRPTLCLLCCNATGGDYRRALPAAAALELTHNFSLVHDDIQDRSAERRHRRTVWSIWGEAQGINVGDAIFVLASQALFRLAERGVPAELVLESAKRLSATTLALCGGQYRDMAFETCTEVGLDEYFAMVRGKTAALLGCSAALGALLGSGDRVVADAYGRFGTSLGVAFQIQDDILGIWGDPKVTGKPAADDVRSRKKTLPVAYALETPSGAHRERQARLRSLYGQPELTEEQVAEVIALLEEVGARAHAEDLARQWSERAIEELDAAQPLPGAREELAAVAWFLVGRTH